MSSQRIKLQNQHKKFQMSVMNFPCSFITLILSIIVYVLFVKKNDFNKNVDIQYKLQLQECLQDKIEATEENLKLAQNGHKSEQNYINLLLKIQELHETLKQKALKITTLIEENQDLKEEIAVLKRLFING